ncbi:MAG: VCBS repeat-containing protein, partial [Acidobacteria bacterium]|nr:VCBS repeat-containing protein [Acidobacteriota bacterium]
MMRIVLVFIGIILCAPVLSGAIPQSERDALIALYNATDGDNWTTNENWLGPPGTECNWYGVSCDIERNHVVRLNLYYDGLNGVIPPEIGDLIYLEELDLNWTQLRGSIPSEIGNLTNLWNLDLHMTQLSGNIPTQIGNLVKLRRLYIGWSELDGSIPTEIGFLTDLEYLNLYANQLSGSIPTEIWGLTALNHLDLGQNQLAGDIPSELANLVNLEGLVLESNQLDGNIPSAIGNLTSLKNLFLQDNQLDGNIPSAIGNLTNLENLDLSGNQISGTIPSSMWNLTNLSRLLLSNNLLGGNIPPGIGNLTNLEYLMLSMNQFSGELPSEIGNLFPLIWLELSDNDLRGNIPPEIGNLTSLLILHLDNNRFSGIIPTQLGALTHLRELFLHCNQLTGSIPTEFGNLESLVRALLSSNRLNGNIPSELGQLADLEQLLLGGNILNGTIPTEVGNLSNLKSLSLPNNALNGCIPSQLGNLSNLTSLSLGSNQLSGVIPSTIWDLTGLVSLQLGGNQLTGIIPSDIARLSNIQQLGLSYNFLSGNIPTETGNLSNIRTLYLHSNQLSGAIPTELMDLANLSYFRLDWNALFSMDNDLTTYINNFYTWFYLSNDFRTMQSTSPENFLCSGTQATSADMSWLPIYQDPPTPGGYEILESMPLKDEARVVYTTDSKEDDGCRICLYPERHYEFAIRTFTDPHDYNDNRVVSEASPPIQVNTGPADSWVMVRFNENQAGPVFADSASQLVPATALTFMVPPDAFPEASPEEPVIVWITLPDGARLSQTLATGTETTTAPLPTEGEAVHDLAVVEYTLAKDGQPLPVSGSKTLAGIGPHAVQLFRYVAGERAVWLRITESTSGWTPDTGDFIGFTIGRPAGIWPDTAASNWGAEGVGKQASTLFYLDLRNYTFDDVTPDFPVRLCSFYQLDGAGRDTGFAPEHIRLFTRSEEAADAMVSSTVNEAIGDHTRVDLDGDGVQDLVTVSPDEARLTWRYGTADGVYTGGDSRDVPGLVPRTVAAGDVTGDARPDILVSDGAGELLIFDWVSLFTVKDTRRPIAPDKRVKLAAVPADACLADVNADAWPDFLYVSPDTGRLGVRYGDAYTVEDLYAAGPGPVALVTGDFDNDGTPDVAVANRDDGTVVLFVNDGSGGFLPAGTTDLGGWPADLAAGRFGDDPWLDLAVGLAEPPGSSLGAVAILTGGPDKNFNLTKIYSPHTPSAVVVDNFDGLHFADILVGFADYEQLGLYVSTA